MNNQNNFLQQTHLLLEQKTYDKNDASLLREVLQFHEQQYYELDSPLISDRQYDQLFTALLQIEKQYPDIITPDSPTQRVGKNSSPLFTTEQHLVPMLSLQNTYNEGDLLDWNKRIADALDTPYTFAIEPKYDGASISLVYENNQLKRALTRGNGIAGDQITANALQVYGIPQEVDFLSHHLTQVELRGEVLMSKKSFEQNNADFLAENKSAFVNARNAASGTLRMKDSREVKKRNLTAFVYHLSYYQLQNEQQQFTCEKHHQCLDLLQQLGFQIAEKTHVKVVSSIAEVIAYCKAFEAQRNNLDYDIDGMVIKINELKAQEQLGMTSHHPRWAVAYKFQSYRAETILEKIEYQVGRTGVISPVAKVKPTRIGGVTVSSISVFNENNIQEKDLRIGDTILIERAGDVIPNILHALPEKRNGSEQIIHFPTQCPSCQMPLMKNTDEAHWRCNNVVCEAQMVERMIYFCSKDAMDIQFLGESKIKLFFQLGFIKNISDLYQLPFDRISNLDGFGEKTITNLQQALQASKNKPAHFLLLGLGIPFVGKTTAQTLCNAITNLNDLKTMSIESLQQLEDVGPKVAHSVQHFFSHQHHLLLLAQLQQQGLNFATTKNNNNIDGTLSGKSFLFTGTLQNRKRSDAEQLVKKLGAQISPSVSSKLDYLIVGQDAGSKLEKAKKIGTVNILNESQFEELLHQKNA